MDEFMPPRPPSSPKGATATNRQEGHGETGECLLFAPLPEYSDDTVMNGAFGATWPLAMTT